ncbi:MAG: hypothetical protein D6794_11920 [Deltaproteobacteria bacterium]|nr:MAG: hypothetical protein D6794_11920 [Deltaproteobacteria bacterium]
MNIRLVVLTLWAMCFLGIAFPLQAHAHGPRAEAEVLRPDPPRKNYRFHRRLPAAYHGYVIEVAASNYPLPRDYAVFGQFGRVYYDKVRRGGYSYVIIPDLRTRKEIERFFETVIKPRVPEARLIRYKHGMRKI